MRWDMSTDREVGHPLKVKGGKWMCQTIVMYSINNEHGLDLSDRLSGYLAVLAYASLSAAMNMVPLHSSTLSSSRDITRLSRSKGGVRNFSSRPALDSRQSTHSEEMVRKLKEKPRDIK